MVEALGALPLPALSFQVNNRKLIQGFYRGLGIPDVTAVIRTIDKLDKLPADAVADLLVDDAGATPEQAQRCLELATIRVCRQLVRRAGARRSASATTCSTGASPSSPRCSRAAPTSSATGSTVEANLRIARGLDYYTGTVVEIFMAGYERLESVGGGGRYDALADDGRTTYPGVGISFGVSRTLLPLIAEGVLGGSRAVPSAVLVALADEESRPGSERIADALRRRGHPVRGGRQRRRSTASRSAYAERRGIPFVWFPAQAATDALRPGQGHPLRRPGRCRPRRVDATRRRPRVPRIITPDPQEITS